MRLSGVATIALSIASTAASSQEAADSLRAAFPTVYVATDTEGEVTGTLVGLTDDAVTVLVAETERRFALEHVSKIEKKGDSLKNGALIGAVIGVAMGLLTSGIADCVSDDGSVGSCGAAPRLGFVAVSAGIYAGAGAGIDALITGRSTLYESPASRASPLARGGLRIRFKLSW